MNEQEATVGDLQRLDTPSTDAHEGAMWRAEIQIDRRHYRCPAPAATADLNNPATWPALVENSGGALGRHWRCEGCSAMWTLDKHWSEPDYRILPQPTNPDPTTEEN